MIRMTRSIYIEAPVKKVFDFLRNPENWPEIAPAWLDATYSDLKLAPDGTGTFRYAARMAGVIRLEGRCEITEVTRNRRIVLRETGPVGGAHEVETFLFERVGSGTTLTVVDEREALAAERVPMVGKLVEWVVDELGVQWMQWLKAGMERPEAVATRVPQQARARATARSHA